MIGIFLMNEDREGGVLTFIDTQHMQGKQHLRQTSQASETIKARASGLFNGKAGGVRKHQE